VSVPSPGQVRRAAASIEKNRNIVQSFHDSGKQVLVQELLGPVSGRLQAGITATVHRMIAEDACVAVQLSGQAGTKEGPPYNNTYCYVFCIQDGKVLSSRSTADHKTDPD
jgi:ketosteroid isomerase-like protein